MTRHRQAACAALWWACCAGAYAAAPAGPTASPAGPAASKAAAPSTPSQETRVESVVLRLMDEANAPARVGGVLVDIDVREGQVVKRGDVLARLDDDDARLAERGAAVELSIAKAKASNDVSVRFARKALEVARAELSRSEESIASFARSVSQSQLDVERLTVERSRLEQEQAEHEQRLAGLEADLRGAELAAAQLERERRRIVAPLSGMVVEVAAKLGEWLEPGQKAFRVVGLDRLKAEGFIPASAARGAVVGAPVRIHPRGAGAGDAVVGRLVFVSPEVDPINNQVRVWAEAPNEGRRLRPGQHVDMVISPAPARDASLADRP